MRIRQVRGFTLYELLIALLLISVGIAVGLQVANSTLRLGSQAHAKLLAVKGVQEYQLEVLRSKLFGDAALNVNTPSGASCSTPTPPPTLSRLSKGATCQYWVESEGTDLKKVTVRVTWTDQDNRARSSTISTLITKGGLTNPVS